MSTDQETPNPADPAPPTGAADPRGSEADSPRPAIGYHRALTLSEQVSAAKQNFRDALNKNSNTVAVVAVAVTLASILLVVYFLFFRGAGAPKKYAWYYDLNTNQLFAADYNPRNLMPIETPSGQTPDGAPAGVRARVFSCGSCDSESDRFVGYLLRAGDDPTSHESVVITTPHGATWVTQGSSEAEVLFDALKAKCGTGQMPDECWPLSK